MKNKSTSHLILTGLFAVLVLAASNSIVRAQECPGTTTWIGGTGSWFNPQNWSPCQPDETIDASINNGGHAQILGGPNHAAAESLVLGDNKGQAGSVTVDGDNSAVLDLGTSACRGNIYIGNRGSGNLTIRNQAYVRSRYGYVAAVANPTRPNSNGNVLVEGTDAVWFLYDYFDPAFGCTGAGLFIGAGGTGIVNVSNGGTIAVVNRADAAGVTVGLSGTLTGNGVVEMLEGTPLSKTVEVRGTLAPAGALTILGNLNLGFLSANTVCHVTPGTWDNVYVSQTTGGGHATLGGRLTVKMTGIFTPGMSFNLLYADAGLGGTIFDFYSIMPPTSGPCFSPVINYEANRVKLDLLSCADPEAEP